MDTQTLYVLAFANPFGANCAPTETADAWSKPLAILKRTKK